MLHIEHEDEALSKNEVKINPKINEGILYKINNTILEIVQSEFFKSNPGPTWKKWMNKQLFNLKMLVTNVKL